MKTIYDELELFRQFLNLVEHHFGENCEILLHDYTGEGRTTILDIRNGQVTNRRAGDTDSTFGLQVSAGERSGEDCYNRIIHTRDGKVIRSSTMVIHGENHLPIGTICLNMDISETVRFEEFLRRYNRYEVAPPSEEASSDIPDVSEMLEQMLQQAQRKVGKSPLFMSREDKLQFLRLLDGRGAFLITKSGDKVCEFLNISKFTLYNYLDTIRKEEAEAQERMNASGKEPQHGAEEN